MGKADLGQNIEGNKKLDDDHAEDREIELRDDSSFIRPTEEDVAVTKASRWVRSALGLKELKSLWHERLGKTYSALWKFDSAIIALQEAIKLDEQSWRSLEGLANALSYRDGTPVSAVLEMEKALKILRNENLDEEGKNSLVENLMSLAEWQTSLHQLDSAIKLYDEVLTVDPKNYEARCGILKTLFTSGYEE